MGVGYFFLLSGFIFFWLYNAPIKKKEISAWEFSVQRFSRLYPLHFLTLLIVALLQLLYSSQESTSFVYPFNDSYHFFLNLIFASNWGFEIGWSFNAPIWSVSIEVLMYIFFFLLALFCLGGWQFCLSISVLALVLSHTVHNPILYGLSLFFLGGFVFHVTYLISTKYQLLKVPIYTATIIFWSCLIINYYIIDLNTAVFAFGVIGKIILFSFSEYIVFPFTVCSLALIEIDRGPFLRPISWIGNITYSSYLLHFPLQLLFGLAVSFGVLNFNFYRNPINLVIYFTILIALSYFVYLKFERPMQKIIRTKLLFSK